MEPKKLTPEEIKSIKDKKNNAIADQNDAEALHFLGSVAGQALLHLFSQNIKLNQLDSVLAQIRSHVIQTVGS